MIKPLAPETLAWLRQSARAGQVEPQVLLHLLEWVDALEADATEQSQSSSFCNEAIVRRLEALEQRPTCKEFLQVPPAPKAALVATDDELFALAELERAAVAKWRACYNLGRQHGATQPPAAQSAAPAVGLVERVAKAIHPSICADPNLYQHEARAAIREVAAWIRSDLNGRSVADRLEQEAGPAAQPAPPAAPGAGGRPMKALVKPQFPAPQEIREDFL
jgi:hypothetical protein